MNALQLSPRISWTDLGTILHADPTTLSRRWSSLNDRGLAWSSCFPMSTADGSRPRSAMALTEVRCAPGARETVIRELSEIREVVSVHCTSGARDLYLTITSPNLAELDRLIDRRVSDRAGVIGTQTHYIRRTFREGSSWTGRSLSSKQTAALLQTLPETPTRAVPRDTRALALVDAIGDDVRRPVAELQRSIGRSARTTARAVDALLVAGWARWRVDFAHTHFGWIASGVIWIRVPQNELEAAAGTLIRMPQVRMCASVTGTANLVVSTWLRDLGEFDALEERLVTAVPAAQVIDRWLIPRVGKRMGHLIDERGVRQRYVPFPVHAPSDLPVD